MSFPVLMEKPGERDLIMGTINYKTSDIITLAVKPISTWDLENDKDFMDEAMESIAEYGGSIDEVINDYIRDTYEADYYNAASVVDEYYSEFFKLSVKYGYYEGVQVVIDSDIDNNMWYFEDAVELSNLADAESLAWGKLHNGLFVIIDCENAWQRFNPGFINPLEYQELDDLLEESHGNMWPSH